MKQLLLFFILLPLIFQSCKQGSHAPATICIHENSAKEVTLAAHEVRKYIYHRTNELLPVREIKKGEVISGDAILIGVAGKELSDDFEYYISVEEGKDFRFPASAPEINFGVTRYEVH